MDSGALVVKYKALGDIMNLELKNVGKIKYANVELNGITVLAGENNTGKSTVGKMLFVYFILSIKLKSRFKKNE